MLNIYESNDPVKMPKLYKDYTIDEWLESVLSIPTSCRNCYRIIGVHQEWPKRLANFRRRNQRIA